MTKWLAILAGLLAVLGSILVWRELRRPYRGYSGNLTVVVDPGMRATEVASLLAERGAIARRWPFLFRYAMGRARHRHLKAGEYLFDRPLSPMEVYRKLVQGEVYLHVVVIPEGSDRFDIARILHQQLGLDSDQLLKLTEPSTLIHDLDSQAPTLEGYLFPDTYRFARGVSPSTVVATMLGRFRRVMDAKFRDEVLNLPSGIHSVMTLASLVEKETPDPAERPVVAGVFARRLEKPMPLQCDPTVIYARRLSDRVESRPITSPGGPITRSELEFDSPYNTYRHGGLPPGPIANPGEGSIRAALNPAPVDFLYFVSNNHGGHIFARTLAEHLRNVARYRRESAQVRGADPETRADSGASKRIEVVRSADAKIRSTKRVKHANKKTKDS